MWIQQGGCHERHNSRKKFHYRFQFHGDEYSGPCEGCEIPPGAGEREIAVLRKKALAFEANRKSQIGKELREKEQIDRDVRKNRTVRALVENYRYELTGGGPVSLEQACELAAAKPSRRQAASKFAGQRAHYFRDFAAYITATYPEVSTLSDVRRRPFRRRGQRAAALPSRPRRNGGRGRRPVDVF